MALKITTQIGTDKGITSEAYVRISDYQISKNGSAYFKIELFQNQEESIPTQNSPLSNGYLSSKNTAIGESLYVSLTNTITTNETVTHPTMNADGESIETTEVREITKVIPDLSSAQGVDIFTFGYTHLKAKLVDLFGAQNVVDC